MSNKKLLIFSADWCLPCRFSKYFWNEMIEEGFPVVLIDGDTNEELRNQYGVDKYPTYILLENDKTLAIVIGKQDKEFLKGLFDENCNVSVGQS